MLSNSTLHCEISIQFLGYSFIIHSKSDAVVNRALWTAILYFYCCNLSKWYFFIIDSEITYIPTFKCLDLTETWLKIANIYFIGIYNTVRYGISYYPSIIHFLCNCFRVKKEKNKIQLQFDFFQIFIILCYQEE